MRSVCWSWGKPTFKRLLARHDFPQNDSKAERSVLAFALKMRLKVGVGPALGAGGAVAVATAHL